jgi:hypothetical protein
VFEDRETARAGATGWRVHSTYMVRWVNGSTDLLKETGERAIGCAKEILTRWRHRPLWSKPRSETGRCFQRDLTLTGPGSPAAA